MAEIWKTLDAPVVPGRAGLLHLALNAFHHGLLKEGFYLANAGVFLKEEEASSLFPVSDPLAPPATIRDPRTITAIAAQALERLKAMRASGHRLRPFPSGYLAPIKTQYARVIAVLEAAGPEALENWDKAVYRARDVDGIGIALAERYALLAADAKIPTEEIARGIERILDFYKNVILPRVYEWEYVEELLGPLPARAK